MKTLEDAERYRKELIAEFRACRCFYPYRLHATPSGHGPWCPAISFWKQRMSDLVARMNKGG